MKHIKYIENGVYPSWISKVYRNQIDFDELAIPNKTITLEAEKLMNKLNANIAVYKKDNYKSTIGICSIFKSENLCRKQIDALLASENKLKDYIFVAYAKPLQVHKAQSI